MSRFQDSPSVVNSNNNYIVNPNALVNQQLMSERDGNQAQNPGGGTVGQSMALIHNRSTDSIIDFNNGPRPGTVMKPSPSGSSTSCFCRICHEGDGSEVLVAPCRCTGTVALIHTSCLEHWLTASNSNKCEICKHVYKIVKEPRPCNEYFNDSSNQFNVRNLIADVICFLLLTPLLVVSTYLCFLGARQYFMRERWEAVGLLILSLFLLAVYFTWCHVTTRFHFSMWRSWQRTHQQIRLMEVHQPHCTSRRGRSRSRSPAIPFSSPMVIQTHASPPSSAQNNNIPFPRSLPSDSHLISLDEENLENLNVSDISRILIV